MEQYKYNMAECTHNGLWQEDMHGKTCLDCGFNTLHNDYGMYNESKPIGLLSKIKEEMEKERGITINNHLRFISNEGMPNNVIIIGENPSNPFEHLRQLMIETGYKPMEFGEKGRWKIPDPDIKPEQVFKIEVSPRLEEPTLFMGHADEVKMFGTKQKKTRKGNNKKYFRRKRK